MDRLRGVRLVLGAAMLGLAIHLVVGDKPWEGEAAELLRQGGKVYFLDLARIYRYWISAGNLLLVALLWWSAPRWIEGREAPNDPALAPAAAPHWSFAWLVAAAMLLAALMAWPRLEFEFWDDERSTVYYFADGGYRQNRSGEVEAWRPRWRRTLLYETKRCCGPNNHVPHTILVRLTLDAWRALAGPEDHFADERVARIPAFLAGLAALYTAALLLRRLGFPAAGVFVAWLLAIHPWFVRYASEARGYSLLLALVPLLCVALLWAFHRGTWPRWLAFAAAGAGVLWIFPGALLVVVAANLAVLGELIRRRRQPGTRVHAVRWLVSTLAAAAVWAQLMLVNLFLFAFHTPWDRREPDRHLVEDILGHLWAGTAWRFRRFGEHYAEVADLANTWPWLFPGLVALVVGLAALGAARLWHRSGPHAWLVAVLVLPMPLTLASQMGRQALFHPWYALYALPGCAILLGIGFEALFARLVAPRARTLATLAGMGIFWAAYTVSSHEVLRAMRSTPIQQSREAVALMRPVRDPLDPANDRVLTASWLRTPFYYDPRVRELEYRDELRALMEEANATGKELFVTWTQPAHTRKRFPSLVRLAEDRLLFEKVAEFHGFEPRGHMLVHRYRGSAP
jgi:hypothetical protein